MSRFHPLRVALLALLALAPPAEADLAKLDPRARIALAMLRAHPPGAPLAADAVTADGALDVFIEGDASRAELEAAGAIVRTVLPGVVTASVPAGAIERVSALAGVRAIRGSAPIEPELDASIPAIGADLLRGPAPAFTGLNGQGVLIGAVDTGLDYTHGDFLDAGGHTRLVSLWDQTVAGTPPAGYAYGTEWSSATLEAGTATETDDTGHGTHVVGIAAGDGSQSTGGPAYAGVAPRADLVFVKTGFGNTQVVDGVAYAFQRAAARSEPAVVNLSLGVQSGPRDGTSPFESALTALTGPGRIVVKSAGNERSVPRHAETFAVPGGSVITLSVSTLVTNQRKFQIEGYYESTENLSLTLALPNGSTIGPLARGSANAAYPGVVTTNGTVYVENGVSTTATGDYEVFVEVNGASGQNMNGTWTFTFFANALGAANGEVDLWRVYNYPGLSANFVQGYQNDELITEPGNATGVITVGAWTSKRYWNGCNGTVGNQFYSTGVGDLAPFSSPGPTRDGRHKPELTAPGTAIASAASFDIPFSCPAAGMFTTYLPDGPNHVMNAGTSMAAPHVTGAVALLLEKLGPIGPDSVRSILAARATTDGFTGATWNPEWGWGKLDVGDFAPHAHVIAPNGGETWNVGDSVSVRWSASDAIAGVSSVDLELSRDGPDGAFATIAAAIPNTGLYRWKVTAPATGVAWVRAVAHDGGGSTGSDLSDAKFVIQSTVAGVDGEPVVALALAPPRPNPARGAMRFAFDLPAAGHVRLVVVDVQGREVVVLRAGTLAAGRHAASWDGEVRGGRAPAGVYLVRLEAEGRALVRRLALVR